ncbi:MAG TPA: hypothetical protein VG032_03510 [Acidimicrobiales bacterium]|jgi:hypothetical protein|nr:hypothetical protein [Acidimicrobiales bacterium]
MVGFRHMIGWLLLGGVIVVSAGAAVLGVSQSPKPAPLLTAVSNTLSASSYTEVGGQNSGQGQQTFHLVYHAPDRLGGYIQSGDRRSYVFAIGTSYYQSVTVPTSTPLRRLTFYRQDNPGGVPSVDPAQNLRYATQAKHVSQSGDTFSFTVTKMGQTGTFTYTVSGQYVSHFTFTVGNASLELSISGVGTSPTVRLPAGAKVVGPPPAAAG